MPMIDSRRVIAMIPARGGSKSIPRKNIRELGGLPLIAWAINVAREVPEVDRVIVSTDDKQVAEIAKLYGAEVYVRASYLATDDAVVIDTIRDLYTALNAEDESADIMILLEPTCPLRTKDDIRNCILRLVGEGLDSIATFKPALLNPCRAWRLDGQVPKPYIDGANPWQPRQEFSPAYQLNGAVYAFYPGRLPAQASNLLFGFSGAAVMPHERSVDIDNEMDFIMAETLLEGSR